MSVAVSADFEPAGRNFRNHFGILFYPKPYQKERSLNVVLIAHVHNFAGFVRAPRRVEADCDVIVVARDRINWDFAAFDIPPIAITAITQSNVTDIAIDLFTYFS